MPRDRLLSLLTPVRCMLLLIGLLAFDVTSRLLYLHSPDALPLAPDEAQYWVWSRHLDWGYYSKPGLIAWLIAASTSLFGQTMPAVRYPAIALGAGTLLLTYFLTLKLFASHRLALGAALLTHIVPMYLAGSMLMTIDAPFCFFWALATTLFLLALRRPASQGGVPWLFLLCGAAVGMGFLAKYTALLFLVGALASLLLPAYRHHLRTPWPYLMAAVALLFTFPIALWNARQDWVTARHVSADIANGFQPLQPFVFIGGTIAAVGPFLFPLIVGATLQAFRSRDATSRKGDAGVPPALGSQSQDSSPSKPLALTALPYLAIVTLTAFTTTAKINWSAPVWFALLILAARFLQSHFANRTSQILLTLSILLAAVLAPISHNTTVLYPLIAHLQTRYLGYPEPLIRRWDPTARLRGWPDLALAVPAQRPANGFILADSYTLASELEFYLPDQPPTHVLGSYLDNPRYRGRLSQWDLWAHRSLEPTNTALLGGDAIFVGPPRSELSRCFDTVEELPPITTKVTVGGNTYPIDTYRLWLCRNFKGLPRPTDGANHY